MAGDVVVGIPRAVAAASMANLNEPDSALDEAPREQKPLAKIVGLLLPDPVETFDRFSLGRKVNRVRG